MFYRNSNVARRWTPLVAALLATGCVNSAIRRTQRACAEPGGAPIAIASASDTASLLGTFRLTLFETADRSREGITVRYSRLQLRMADSAERTRAAERKIGNSPRVITVIGTYDTASNAREESVEFRNDRLLIGCAVCTHYSPLALDIHALSGSGFNGTWLHSTVGSSYRYVRKDGRLWPEPGGHFCAERIVAPSSQ